MLIFLVNYRSKKLHWTKVCSTGDEEHGQQSSAEL